MTLDLKIGPLVYRFIAHDFWGEYLLDRLKLHLQHHAADIEPDRRIYVARQRPAGDQWHCSSNPVDTIWHAAETTDVYWSQATGPSIGKVRFDLPWSLIIGDIIERGGGLVHAGLAIFREAGFLFLAPPSGGKSTTLGTAPEMWSIVSDDAALVWPAGDGWLASPLPAWGDILRVDEPWPWLRMSLDQSYRLAGLFVIRKSRDVRFDSLTPSQAMPAIYQALNEYPVKILTGVESRQRLFRLSAEILRTLPTWRLSLPRGADIWSRLEGEVA